MVDEILRTGGRGNRETSLAADEGTCKTRNSS